jgi:predicted dehydrogenase
LKALVIGYGSIGARHARILSALGHDTAVVSKRAVDYPDYFSDLETALHSQAPDYVVIANATIDHFATVCELSRLGYKGIVLVEKPVFSRVEPLPPLSFRRLVVAYNLRFHPLIQRLRALLEGETILSATCLVGQYLPDWRPGTDYRQSYSSHADQGGGVLRDLSHELDFLAYLFGPWLRVCASGGHLSALEGDSDDIFGLILEFEHCPITMLHMSYTDRIGRRQIVVQTDSKTIEVDLVKGLLIVNDVVEQVSVERDQSYRAMHEAAIAGHSDIICTLHQATETVALIGAAERSARQACWVASQ